MVEITPVCEFESSNVPIWYVALGHVDKEEFAKAIAEQYELPITLDRISHTYMRKVPICIDGEYTYTIYLSKPGRGAYKVTYWDADW